MKRSIIFFAAMALAFVGLGIGIGLTIKSFGKSFALYFISFIKLAIKFFKI